MWGQSLPWHKVLNAVVAELSIYKWKNQRGRIDSLLLWVSRLSARQTELSVEKEENLRTFCWERNQCNAIKANHVISFIPDTYLPSSTHRRCFLRSFLVGLSSILTRIWETLGTVWILQWLYWGKLLSKFATAEWLHSRRAVWILSFSEIAEKCLLVRLTILIFFSRYVTFSPNVANFSGIRTVRVLRALRTISVLKGESTYF